MTGCAHQNQFKPQERVTGFRRFNIGVAVFLCLTVTGSFVSTGYSQPAPQRSYDGVTLYRALYFASGPLVNKIPSLRKAAPYFPAEYKRLEPQTIKYIESKDPAFFGHFATEIQSGDRVRVARALRSTHRVQIEALQAVTNTSRTKMASAVRKLKVAAEPEAENDANVAAEVEVWLFVAVAVAAVAVIFAWFFAPPTESQLKGLSFERYVNEIVRAVPTVRDHRG